MTPEELKTLLYEFLAGKIEDLLVIDRFQDTQINEEEIDDLIYNKQLTLDELTNKFRELARPYFDNYPSRSITNASQS